MSEYTCTKELMLLSKMYTALTELFNMIAELESDITFVALNIEDINEAKEKAKKFREKAWELYNALTYEYQHLIPT